jgi:hypothetical protein
LAVSTGAPYRPLQAAAPRHGNPRRIGGGYGTPRYGESAYGDTGGGLALADVSAVATATAAADLLDLPLHVPDAAALANAAAAAETLAISGLLGLFDYAAAEGATEAPDPLTFTRRASDALTIDLAWIPTATSTRLPETPSASPC